MNNTILTIPANTSLTRQVGSEFRKLFLETFKSMDHIVTVDFSQVGQLDNEFADECFGILTLDYSLSEFYKRVYFLNAQDCHLMTIATHIVGREQQRIDRRALIKQQIPSRFYQPSRLQFA
jgi:hypothetical protein